MSNDEFVRDFESRALARSRELNDKIRTGKSKIREIYNDAVIFITGGTGFLGKQLIEKLLRANQNIKKVYLLMRPKRGKSAEERLKFMLEEEVFDVLRDTVIAFQDKIQPIEGDTTELRLGIGDQDWKTLTDEVNFIFHVAATTRFNEPLTRAVLTNVRGTRETVSLARECSKLVSFVYVSTAYVHCYKTEVEEKFYDCPIRPQTIIELVEQMDVKKIDEFTPIITQQWPNTYTFTKALSEEVVRTMGVGLPICIIRPAIVICSFTEPTPGWLDKQTKFGISGLVYGLTLGGVHTYITERDVKPDVVPVDLVNNLAISAAWATTERNKKYLNDIQIYNLSGYRRNTTLGYVIDFFINDGTRWFSPKALYYCYGFSVSNKWMFSLLTIILHFIPAVVADGVLIAMRKEPRAVKIYKMLFEMNSLMAPFFCNEWKFHDTNTVELFNSMSKDDRIMFNCDIATIDMTELLSVWIMGVRKFLLRDGLKDNDYARKKQIVLMIAHYTFYAIILYLSWKVISMVHFFYNCLTQYL